MSARRGQHVANFRVQLEPRLAVQLHHAAALSTMSHGTLVPSFDNVSYLLDVRAHQVVTSLIQKDCIFIMQLDRLNLR